MNLSKQIRHLGFLPIIGLVSISLTAQEQDENNSILDLETFVVQSAPIYHSQQQSIQLQREAIGLVNVVASDAIGQFPDQNAAAALARLPAVAVQRDQGQERFIQVRGAPSRWTSVAFDGVNVLGAEERIFRFDSVPAVIIDTLEVIKTLTSDMPAESIAGRVNIKTVSALDVDGYEGSMEMGYGYLDLGEGMQRRAAVSVLTRHGKWGVGASISHYLMDQTTDNREYSWNSEGLPTDVDFRSYQLRRQNNSGSLKLEYEADENNRYYFSSVYGEFIDNEERNQYVMLLEDAIYGDQTENGGDLVGVPMRGYMQYGRYLNSTHVNTLGGEHQHDDWSISWKLNYTKTEATTDIPIVLQLQTDPSEFHSVAYDSSDRDTPTFHLYQTIYNPDAGIVLKGEPVNRLNQTGFGLDLLIPVFSATYSDAYNVSADFEREWTSGNNPAKLKFGIQYDDRTADGNTFSGLSTIYLSPLAAAVGLPWDSNSYVTDAEWDSNFARGFDVNYNDNKAARDDLNDTLEALSEFGLYDAGSTIADPDKFDITENILAAYLMNSWDFGFHKIIAGVRVESVKQSSSGFVDIEGTINSLSVDHDYTDLFPSLHYSYDLSETVKFRFAGVTGIGRPDFGDVRTGAIVSDAGESVSGGNPYLEPETTYGFDSSLEWYFEEGALIAVSVFHREVENPIYDFATVVGDDRYNTEGVDRSGYDYSTTLNGDTGSLSGLELSYLQRFKNLPSAFSGLGVQFNLALLDGEFETLDGRSASFPGTSDMVMNASLFYENYGFSARLSYQWRDDWVDDLTFNEGEDYYWAATERIDFSIRYQINEQLSIYADINNLSNEGGVRYQGEREYPVEVEGFGRKFLFGVRSQF